MACGCIAAVAVVVVTPSRFTSAADPVQLRSGDVLTPDSTAGALKKEQPRVRQIRHVSGDVKQLTGNHIYIEKDTLCSRKLSYL